MTWEKARVFERKSKVHSYSKKALSLGGQSQIHLFIPWSSNEESDLMFRLKSIVTKNQSTFIPYMNLNYENGQISEADLDLIKKQISKGVETHLYMSNLESIHIWKIKDIVGRTDYQKLDTEKTIPFFKKMNHFELWVEVEDVFVLKASHTAGKSDILNELENVVSNFQTHQIFSPIQKLYVDDASSDAKRAEIYRWVEVGRSVTYDYFIRSCELEDNIYQDCWRELSRATQHCLIVAEQTRHNSVLYQNEQKLYYLKESFENYLSALMNELNEIYIRPFISVFHEYPVMHEAWREIQGAGRSPVHELINALLEQEKDHVGSIQDFLKFIKNAKSFFFSLKNKFARRIGREEDLQLENFLSRQENLVESFLAKRLDVKLNNLLQIKDWFKDIVSGMEGLDKESLRICTLKITHLLTIMSSYNYDDNIFFKIIEEKTSRGVVRRTFEEEIKSLLTPSNDVKAA